MLREKVVVITGGAGLLGSAFSRAVADNGASLVVADQDASAIERLLESLPPQARSHSTGEVVDISRTESVTALIRRVQGLYGRIDAVVNNAYPRNANYGRRMEDVTYGDFCENVSMHLGGYFLVAQQFGLCFREQGHGNIVNMSSVYGVIAPRFGVYEGTSMTMPVEYAAIKSAVIHLTRYFAQCLKDDGVRVNSISPGGIFNNQPDEFVRRYNSACGKKGMLSAEDVAGALVFLLSDMSQSMTGQNLIVDDGFSL